MLPARRLLALAPFALLACHRPAPTISVEPPPTTTAPSSSAEPTSAPTAEPAAAIRPPGPRVRERKEVVVDGVTEAWRLEWTEEPVRECFDGSWSSCTCTGLAFGEMGKFDLVRERPGAPEERLHFEGALPRWPVIEADEKRWPGAAVDAEEVTRRPDVELMRFGDYDHDGRATELVLQVGAGGPCSRTWSELVGVDRKTNRLHVYGTVAHPDQPLVLAHLSSWDEVLKKPSVEVMWWRCGDHGAEQEQALLVRATPAGFVVDVHHYECVDTNQPARAPRRGRLLEQRPWDPTAHPEDGYSSN
jgi:hypothetical protein